MTDDQALTPVIAADRQLLRAKLFSLYPSVGNEGFDGLLGAIDEADARAFERRIKGTFRYWESKDPAA